MNLEEIGFDIPFGRIAGLRSGTTGGPKVLALHGWLDNAASFLPLASQLPALDLVMLDLPGHGRSGHLGPGADYNLLVTLNAVLDVVDALGWERFALLGHSMGAGIGSILAASLPQRVERLVAIEALGALAEAPERTAQRLRDGVAAARALPAKKLRVFPDLGAPVRARMQANQLSEASARLLVERGVTAVDGGFVWSSDPRLTLPALQRMTEAQVRALIAAIDCPVRVIFADPAQTYLPEPLRSERAALLPQGELTVLPGIHHLHMEAPVEVAHAIGGFFGP
ncbi:alpha/beta fold hydrolase [Pseudoxanthomonas sacheonensis]|uniref:Pimeloyl-ACP methyl ester carboxylesterase n=1 Tax=Pseudoxanthomonas sacheonensis TaxID=443615 RepID=A0ABU1RSZ0_9GAMM|nr:alpha/beta hydrolase [Pseudoxanthomonas sacheonensis]MDR6841892.1 pimeloyl-ACP methyl ester carboxylesterase [Pseudoxanthomonas sacheonensis]